MDDLLHRFQARRTPERPLNERQQQILFSWIQNGAEWPEGVVLEEKPRVTYEGVKALLQKGGPFKKSEIETLRYWEEQGADWQGYSDLRLSAGISAGGGLGCSRS